MKSLGHQARFIKFNRTIGITLNPKYPFASNDIASSVRRNKSPGLIFKQSIKLSIPGCKPIGVIRSSGEARRFKNGGITISKKSTQNWISHGTVNEGFRFGDGVFRVE